MGDEVELFIWTENMEINGSRDPQYSPTEGLSAASFYLDATDKNGTWMLQVLSSYAAFRGAIPFQITSRFADLEDIYKVFKELPTVEEFLSAFQLDAVHVYDRDLPEKCGLETNFVSVTDRRFILEFRVESPFEGAVVCLPQFYD